MLYIDIWIVVLSCFTNITHALALRMTGPGLSIIIKSDIHFIQNKYDTDIHVILFYTKGISYVYNKFGYDQILCSWENQTNARQNENNSHNNSCCTLLDV